MMVDNTPQTIVVMLAELCNQCIREEPFCQWLEYLNFNFRKTFYLFYVSFIETFYRNKKHDIIFTLLFRRVFPKLK